MKPFKNEQLKEVYNLAKKKNYKVYTFETRAKHISQIFIENIKNQIGSCEAYFGGVRFSTIHKPIEGSGNGTGFGGLIKGKDFNDPEDLDICFINAPYWYNGKLNPKYNGFEEYENVSYKRLKYFEI